MNARIHGMFPIFAAALLLSGLIAVPLCAEGKREPKVGADSLATLRVLIRSELDAKSRIWTLKEPRWADSLARLRYAPRGEFDRLMRDSAAGLEIHRGAEFREYWKTVEAQNGFTALKQELASRDLDQSRVPKLYLFDSSVVIYPGVIAVRMR